MIRDGMHRMMSPARLIAAGDRESQTMMPDESSTRNSEKRDAKYKGTGILRLIPHLASFLTNSLTIHRYT